MNLRWAVQYEDESVFNQFQENGDETSYDHLPNRDKIRAFALWDHDSGRVVLALHLDPEQKLVYRRRCELKQGEKEPIVVYLVGWRRTVNGECIQSIAYVFEADGRIELAGKFDPKHRWFYEPTLREFEK